MLIPLVCNSCNTRFEVDAQHSGTHCDCPNRECAARILVPTVANDSRNADETGSDAATVRTDQAASAVSPIASSRRRIHKRGILLGLVLVAVGVAVVILRVTTQRFNADLEHSEPIRTNDTGDTVAAARINNQVDAHPQPDRTDIQPFLTKYCLNCHGPTAQKAGLSLEEATTRLTSLDSLQTWETVVEMLQEGAMPPEEHPASPDDSERQQAIQWIESTFLDVDSSVAHDPGRVTIQRLNRAEYANTIRDLFGVDLQPAEDLPADDVGEGFDNIGDVLTLPPLLMEKFFVSAERIAESVVFAGDYSEQTIQRHEGSELTSTLDTVPDEQGFHHINSAGAVSAEFQFTAEGEYILRAEASAEQAGDEPARMEFRVDGKEVDVHTIRANRTPGIYESRLNVEAGKPFAIGSHRVEAIFINDYFQLDDPDPEQRDRNLLVRSLELQGPIGSKPPEYPATHKEIIFTTPGPENPVSDCARVILQKFANRAFRRSVTKAELDRLVKLVQLAVAEEDSFERGIQLAIQSILVSPHFLFRVERDSDPNNPQAVRRLDAYELASRLSYFFWSSMPDDELFALAEKDVLHQPEILEQQVLRMLNDEKSRALVENFAGQWLNLRRLAESTPDPKRFPTFNEQLRADMRRETELFFETIVREDRSVLEMIDASFSFMNERLAAHYGIPDVEGEQFQQVALTGNRRAGVLTHASILTLTSGPSRTMPVKRGKWILENILGTPPPAPPPDVPELSESTEENSHASMRERLEQHRARAECASCHELMDPLGLGLENYDAIGRWRDNDGEIAIDSSGVLPSGESFSGPVELASIIAERGPQFARHFAEKLLTYALGRGLMYYDKRAVDAIADAHRAADYRSHALFLAIVKSEPFLMRRGDGGKP